MVMFRRRADSEIDFDVAEKRVAFGRREIVTGGKRQRIISFRELRALLKKVAYSPIVISDTGAEQAVVSTQRYANAGSRLAE